MRVFKFYRLEFVCWRYCAFLCLLIVSCSTTPSESTKLVDAGVAQARAGNYRQAIELFDRAIDIDSCLALAYFDRAFSYEQIGDDTAAIKDYTSAINCDSSYQSAYFNRGYIRFDRGELEEALHDYSMAYSVDTSFLKAKGEAALTLFELGLLDSAISVISEVIAKDSTDAAYYNNRGEFLRVKGEFQLALADLLLAKKFDTSDFEVYHSLASLYRDIGDTSNEIESIRQYLKFADSSDSNRIDSMRMILNELCLDSVSSRR